MSKFQVLRARKHNLLETNDTKYEAYFEAKIKICKIKMNKHTFRQTAIKCVMSLTNPLGIVLAKH